MGRRRAHGSRRGGKMIMTNENKGLERVETIAALRYCASGESCKGCPLGQHDGITCAGFSDMLRKAASLLERDTEPPNEPLTLEELRGMDGEPVWVEFVGKPDGSPIPPLWMLVDVGSKQLVTGAEFVDWREESWFAYRRKPAPEEGEKNV